MNFIESTGMNLPKFVDKGFVLDWAKPNNADKITKLVNAGYTREITRKENTLRYQFSNEVLEEIKKVNKVGWLILLDPKDNKIIGSLEIKIEESKEIKIEESKKHTICAFAIDKDYSGQGLGHIMLENAELAVRNKKVNKVFLDVISVATKKLPEVEKWTPKTKKFEAETDSLADFYQKKGFTFTMNRTLTPISWQKKSRKTEYVGLIFFREMCKEL